MPIAPWKQNQQRRKKLLDCALDLFITKGYFNTSIRDIVVASGFGTGTFYNYFIDKEDVLKALLEAFAADIISSIRDYYAVEEDLYERFIETKRLTMAVFAQNEKLSEIYSRVAGASEPIDQCLKQFEDKLLEFYSKNLRYGIEMGIFQDVPVLPVAHAVMAVEKYLLYKWVVLRSISEEEMIDMVVSFHETLARGLVKSSGKGGEYTT